MQIGLRLFAVILFLVGIGPVYAISSSDNAKIEKLSSELARLRAELNSLKDDLKVKPRKAGLIVSPRHVNRISQPETHIATPPTLKGRDLIRMIIEDQNYMPFDLDVPGQAFVSTGPYVGVPVQYAGSDLVINSPSVNTDLQLLGIRKHIIRQLNLLGSSVFKEPYHSHLLLSGVVEAQVSFNKPSGRAYRSDIDVTNVSLDSFFVGPSDWTLGYIEFSFINAPPNGTAFRVNRSRVFVNKAFITIGNLTCSPFYGTVGQFFVPFGTYSSLMISDTLPKLLGRTKARALQIGFQQQSKQSLYGALYAFRGDSHTRANRINNGGINLGFKFQTDFISGNIGGGVISNIADSGGMQLGNGFTKFEKIHHRVPAYDVRGIFNVGPKVNLIAEFVAATRRFSVEDMSFKTHGAKPWAFDTQAAYSFYVFEKPSSVGVGYGQSSEALSLGLPKTRIYTVFNTSIWRNTLQSIEYRHDRNYAASAFANGPVGAISKVGACTSVVCRASGKSDNAVTAQFDYYF